MYKIQRHLLGITRVWIFQHWQVGVVKKEHELFLQGGAYHPTLVVSAPLLFLLLEEALLLTRRRPWWGSLRYSWVRRADEGGFGNTRVLLGKKDDTDVAVLPSAEGNIKQRRNRCQDLVDLLYGGVIGLARVLG